MTIKITITLDGGSQADPSDILSMFEDELPSIVENLNMNMDLDYDDDDELIDPSQASRLLSIGDDPICVEEV